MQEKLIKKCKEPHGNIFPEMKRFSPERMWKVIVALITSSAVNETIPIIVEDDCIQMIIFAICTFLVLIIMLRHDRKIEIRPYGMTDHFAGLYCADNLGKLQLDAEKGLLSREEEVNFLRNLITDILPQKDWKQGICLIGKSGCGKSTILYLLQKKLSESEDIKVLNYSQKYQNVGKYLEKDLGKTWKTSLWRKNEKIVIIFDQFERIFFKDRKIQDEIITEIRKLSVENVAIIFSIREEYLASFSKLLNIDNLKDSKNAIVKRHGIIEDRRWSYNSNNIEKNNTFLICLDEVDGIFETSEGEEGSNEDDIRKKSLWLQCENAFGTRANEMYSKVKGSRLIQQQIILNMLKNEENSTGYMDWLKYDESYYLRRYFDVQLCSTGDFFTASRVMYLLCIGNLKDLYFEITDVKMALCIPDIGYEKTNFEEVLKRLRELQLIKEIVYTSKEYYEIAHDYIARTFESYANTEMAASVRAALDEYVTEYINNTEFNKNVGMYQEKRALKSPFKWVLILSILICLGSCIWGLLFQQFHVEILIVPALAVASLIYIFCFFFNITRFYPGRNRWVLITLFISTMLCGVVSVFCDSHWLVCFGLGNALNGIACLYIGAGKTISRLGKKMYMSYGGKTTLMGILFCLLNFLLEGMVSTGNIFVVEAIAMGVLLIYGYKAHLTDEFVYVHLEGLFSTNR